MLFYISLIVFLTFCGIVSLRVFWIVFWTFYVIVSLGVFWIVSLTSSGIVSLRVFWIVFLTSSGIVSLGVFWIVSLTSSGIVSLRVFLIVSLTSSGIVSLRVFWIVSLTFFGIVFFAFLFKYVFFLEIYLESRYKIFCYNYKIITRLLVIYEKMFSYNSVICTDGSPFERLRQILIVCSWLNDVAPSKIPDISLTLLTFQLFNG